MWLKRATAMSVKTAIQRRRRSHEVPARCQSRRADRRFAPSAGYEAATAVTALAISRREVGATTTSRRVGGRAGVSATTNTRSTRR